TVSISTTTATSTRLGPSSSVASIDRTTPSPPTAGPARSPPTTPSGASSTGDWPSSAAPLLATSTRPEREEADRAEHDEVDRAVEEHAPPQRRRRRHRLVHREVDPGRAEQREDLLVGEVGDDPVVGMFGARRAVRAVERVRDEQQRGVGG